ncbi:sensor histidine kinase [Motilimonas eburnea]|uniref:sensor histidine kinase n=1 Tax=Motilimonas eburnea TaxID=1737488 RepID=UPI001E3C5B6C|nr:histidine kinase [Motilimonas eburnea]MCE2570488.1 histidine kinase [Motilimonas eburnea]
MVIHSWQLKEKALELEMSLKQSEISLLRIQTNPHFLFNTLNLLHSEIPERPELAQELIFELSDLLRGTIAVADKKRISLHDEVALIEHYLAIQKARFTERLDVKMDIDRASQSLQIPPMLILPLVENVIKHALSKTINKIYLEVKTRYVDGVLSILVNNTWSESAIPQFEAGSGHGNISETLGLEYDNANFSISFANQVTSAVITIRPDF